MMRASDNKTLALMYHSGMIAQLIWLLMLRVSDCKSVAFIE